MSDLPGQHINLLGLPKYIMCLLRGHLTAEPKRLEWWCGYVLMCADTYNCCPRCGKILEEPSHD